MKGCPAFDGGAHMYGAHKVITVDLKAGTEYSRISKVTCAFCGHARRGMKASIRSSAEIVQTVVYHVQDRISFDRFKGWVREYDYDADKKGRRL